MSSNKNKRWLPRSLAAAPRREEPKRDNPDRDLERKNMNRMFTARACTALFFTVLPGLALCQGIRVYVDSKVVAFPVGQPMEYKGNVMVPLRGVFERLGGAVGWDGAAQTVTINKGTMTIRLTVGESHATKNEETIAMP